MYSLRVRSGVTRKSEVNLSRDITSTAEINPFVARIALLTVAEKRRRGLR